MALIYILQHHYIMSFVEFWLLQVKVSCDCQNAVSFNVIKKKFDFIFGPLATGLVKVF